jgi:hypothetical protein
LLFGRYVDAAFIVALGYCALVIRADYGCGGTDHRARGLFLRHRLGHFGLRRSTFLNLCGYGLCGLLRNLDGLLRRFLGGIFSGDNFLGDVFGG